MQQEFPEKYLHLTLDGIANCPMLQVLNLLSRKWRAYIVFVLFQRPSFRFGELKKALPSITNTMLAEALRDLEQIGIVRREQFNEIPPHVEYSLTEMGRALFPTFRELLQWGETYLQDEDKETPAP